MRPCRVGDPPEQQGLAGRAAASQKRSPTSIRWQVGIAVGQLHEPGLGSRSGRTGRGPGRARLWRCGRRGAAAAALQITAGDQAPAVHLHEPMARTACSWSTATASTSRCTSPRGDLGRGLADPAPPPAATAAALARVWTQASHSQRQTCSTRPVVRRSARGSGGPGPSRVAPGVGAAVQASLVGVHEGEPGSAGTDPRSRSGRSACDRGWRP